MPLPDASKKSPRVYTLLQNTDLDSVTFANVQAVGNPIAIEEANEDEMRRLVLVNLCRLVTSGEWTGLLDAGGGGGEEMLGGSPNGDWQSSFAKYQCITVSHARSATATSTLSLSGGRQFFWPFTSAMTGDLTTIGLNIKIAVASENVRVGIYNAADDGNPSDLIGYADFDASSTGEQFSTSLSDTIALERGTLYWYAVVQTTGGADASLDGMNCTYSGASQISNNTWPKSWTMVNYATTDELSDPAALDEMRGGSASYPPAHVAIGWL